jgi:hypothetical protein
MHMSEQIDQIAAALAAAQAELVNPPKLKVNPHFKSSYVDLSDGLAAVRKTLSAHGISFVQATDGETGVIILHTCLMHSSGQWIKSTYPVASLGKHQEMGGALTYARRYALFAMVGIAGEDDMDGNDAADATNAVKPARPAKPTKEMEPGLPPDESEKVYMVMLESLQMAQSREDLVQWATANQKAKVRLTPKHQAMITEEFKKVESQIKGQ